MYGNLMMLGVITSSVKKVSLHTNPDVCITHGYVFMLLGHIYIQAAEFFCSINLGNGQ